MHTCCPSTQDAGTGECVRPPISVSLGTGMTDVYHRSWLSRWVPASAAQLCPSTALLTLSVCPHAVVHAVDGISENGIQPLSSSEVDELIHKADEVTLSEAGSTAGPAEPRGLAEDVTRTTPSRREITGVEAQPGEATSGPPGIQPGQEPPVTMVFMGYQNVEDEAETKKVLGLQDTIKAELVVIEDAATPREPAPLNGSAAELPATKEEIQAGTTTTPSDTQDLDMKKPRCRCCSVM